MATTYPTSRDRFGMAVKVEGTYGTDATPTFSANALRLTGRPEVNESFMAENSREDDATGGLGSREPAPRKGRLHEITFTVVPKSIGSSNSSFGPNGGGDPNVDPILQTIFSKSTSDSAITYTMDDQPATGLTVYTEVGGKKYVTRGAVPNSLSMNHTAGETPKWEVTLTGIADDVEEQELEAATYSDVADPTFTGANLSVGTFTPTVESFNIDLGLETAERGDANAADAHAGYRIVRRRPSMTMTAEREALTDWDPHEDMQNSSRRSSRFTVGSTSLERYKVRVDNATAQADGVSETDLDGLEGIEASYGIHTPSSSSDELAVVFD